MKLPFKETVGMHIFSLVMFGGLFALIWFDHSSGTSKYMAHIATFGYVVYLVYLLKITKFK